VTAALERPGHSSLTAYDGGLAEDRRGIDPPPPQKPSTVACHRLVCPPGPSPELAGW
jgi:hypothetical protein